MKKNQKGIALIETLLIILILVIIGFGGYYVWHTQKQTDKILNQAAATSQKTTATKPAQKYFTIKEWGVRAAYNGKFTLNYTIQDNGTEPALALFSSKQLEASDSACSANNGDGGIVQRYRSTDEIFLEDGTDSKQSAADFANTLNKSDYGHAGNYYYFFKGPQAQCGVSQNSGDIQTQTVGTVKSLLAKLQAIPQ